MVLKWHEQTIFQSLASEFSSLPPLHTILLTILQSQFHQAHGPHIFLQPVSWCFIASLYSPKTPQNLLLLPEIQPILWLFCQSILPSSRDHTQKALFELVGQISTYLLHIWLLNGPTHHIYSRNQQPSHT